jgi:hypothetical protein
VQQKSSKTSKEYIRLLQQWERDGQPPVKVWLATLTPDLARNARAALVWHGVEVEGVRVPRTKKAGRSLTHEELAACVAEGYVRSRRVGLTIEAQYATGLASRRSDSTYSYSTAVMRVPHFIRPTPRRNSAAARVVRVHGGSIGRAG